MTKGSFLLYIDQYPPIARLSLEQKGMLLDAFFVFNEGKEAVFDDPVVEMAFAFFRQSFERDTERYERKCQKNRDNVSKRYTQSTTEYDRIRSGSDNESGSDNDPDIDTDPTDRLSADDPADASAQHDEKGREKAPSCPHRQIVDLYHEILPELPRVKIWEGQRQQNLATRWRERWTAKKYRTQSEGMDYFRRLFVYIRDSDFLMGRTTDRQGKSFMASLDWIVLPRNFAKVIEGRYHDKKMDAAA